MDALRPASDRTRSAELGGEPGDAPLRYVAGVEGGHDPLLTALRERRGRDIERAVTTGVGPHLDDYAIEDGGPRPAAVRIAGRAAAGAAWA